MNFKKAKSECDGIIEYNNILHIFLRFFLGKGDKSIPVLGNAIFFTVSLIYFILGLNKTQNYILCLTSYIIII